MAPDIKVANIRYKILGSINIVGFQLNEERAIRETKIFPLFPKRVFITIHEL